MRTSHPSATQEIEAAAKWARARLEEGRKSIGVVVPDLRAAPAARWRACSRASCSRATTSPAPRRARCRSTSRSAAAFVISIGEFRARTCRCWLSQTGNSLRHSASDLVRSPFLGGADSELGRARIARCKAAPRARGALVAAQAHRRRRAGRRSCASCSSSCSRCATTACSRDARRMGAPLLGAARRRRLPRRARARLGRIPGAAPSGTRCSASFRSLERIAPSFRFGEAFRFLRAASAPRRCSSPSRRRRADPGARHARVGGAALRPSVGERPHRRGLAAARRAPIRSCRSPRRRTPACPQASAEASARARPAHHRRLEARRRRGGVLLAGERQGPGPRAQSADLGR